MLFTKQEVKDRWRRLRDGAATNDGLTIDAELSIAMLIVGNDLLLKKQRSGEDFVAHPMHIASSFHSKNKRITSLLHDLLEDSKGADKWTLEDLREIGFSERILTGVDGVTRRENEAYFDFIIRCGQSGEDAIDIKIEDLRHNMDGSRYRHIDDNHKEVMKQKIYNIAYHYLVDIKKFRADGLTHYNAPGTSMVDYVKSRKEFADHPVIVNQLLDMFSSEKERLPAPTSGASLTATWPQPS